MNGDPPDPPGWSPGAGALEPDNGQSEITVGDRLAMEGRFAEALEAFQRALALDPVRAGPLVREKIAAAKARLGHS
jgi:Flp pilus assembly protein TadD